MGAEKCFLIYGDEFPSGLFSSQNFSLHSFKVNWFDKVGKCWRRQCKYSVLCACLITPSIVFVSLRVSAFSTDHSSHPKVSDISQPFWQKKHNLISVCQTVRAEAKYPSAHGDSEEANLRRKKMLRSELSPTHDNHINGTWPCTSKELSLTTLS